MDYDSSHLNFDLDITHYNIHELLELFSLDDNASIDDIDKRTREYINKSNNQLAIKQFYTDSRHKLLHNVNIKKHDDIIEEDDKVKTESNIGTHYDYDKVNRSGPDYLDKTNTYNEISYIKGDKNPLFKSQYHSIVNIDSSYRELSDSTYTSTNFMSTLTFALSNVIEYSIYSLEIPYAWYTFSKSYGNVLFIVNDITITIPDGNYSSEKLITNINSLLSSNSIYVTLTIDTITNYVTMTNNGTTDYTFTLYDVTNNLFSNSLQNINLGYNLGFTSSSSITLTALSTLKADSSIYIYGPRYLLLKLDEYAMNRASSGLIGTMHQDKKCAYPSYLSRDLTSTQTGDNSTSFQISNSSTPKRLTQAKAYTINAILEGRKTNTTTTQSAPSKSSDMMLKIPIPDQDILFNSPNKCYSETGGFLSNFTRTFFGKINLFKLHTQLLDDKGRTLDLNGQDWSYTILVKHLYQY